MRACPNITINRVSQSFDDLQTTLRLALTGDDAPDVVEANNGRSTMGQLVAAGQLRSLDPWISAYGWDAAYPPSILAYSSYSADGATKATLYCRRSSAYTRSHRDPPTHRLPCISSPTVCRS